MAKSILDDGLRRWEAFATTGEGGLPEPGRIVFRCTSDPHRRPRVVAVHGDKSDAEQRVAEGSERDLLALFEGAREIR
jgi:hypothetical protein